MGMKRGEIILMSYLIRNPQILNVWRVGCVDGSCIGHHWPRSNVRTTGILSLMVDDELGKKAHQSLHKHELTSHIHLFLWYITEIRILHHFLWKVTWQTHFRMEKLGRFFVAEKRILVHTYTTFFEKVIENFSPKLLSLRVLLTTWYSHF